MKVLRMLLLIVLLAGSTSSPAAHALRMPTAGAPAPVTETAQPPCHQDADRAAAADPEPASHHHDASDSGDCCTTGQCDCVHASPGALVVPALPGLSSMHCQPPRAHIADLMAGTLDTPLRPPAP